ncbi:hypothetical protein IVB03_38890 [Bradyrhizobium sp. 168]|uniref:hypothetical protein n=1 Tax=Bradyrhizobium sp. 168 TaxID=2782639 RepID=UPI001FFB09AB|nr:hypothetical protein [Bradyrhizobium sp. 168]MCK1585373.1 hypothetical protein [Bradyrhizobium sp. 168]
MSCPVKASQSEQGFYEKTSTPGWLRLIVHRHGDEAVYVGFTGLSQWTSSFARCAGAKYTQIEARLFPKELAGIAGHLEAPKLDRNTRIGGQPAKLVRDLLADATNSDGFFSDLVNEHLFRTWWRATINELIETGKLDASNRGHALRLWTTARSRGKIFGVRLPKVPDFTLQTHGLIGALLAQELICDDRRESDGRTVYRVTDEGHATGMKSLGFRLN